MTGAALSGWGPRKHPSEGSPKGGGMFEDPGTVSQPELARAGVLRSQGSTLPCGAMSWASKASCSARPDTRCASPTRTYL